MRHFFIILILIYASVQDIKTMEVPDRCFILILFCTNQLSLISIKNFLLVALLYLMLLIASSILDKDVPIGMADAKIFAALAFALGLEQVVNIFVYTSLISGLYAAHLIRPGDGSPALFDKPAVFPLVPFITLGTLGSYLQLLLQNK